MTSAVNRLHVRRCIEEELQAHYVCIPREVRERAAEAAVRIVEDGLDQAARTREAA